MDLKQLVRPEVLAMTGYNPGPSLAELCRAHGVSKMAEMGTNENAWGSSPKALAAIREALARVERYPDAASGALRAALAKANAMTPEHFVAANGADNLLSIIGACFLRPGDKVVVSSLTFPVYRSVASLAGASFQEVPHKDYCHDLAAMARAVDRNTRMVFVCNPNNPTGACVPPRELEAFLHNLPESVVAVLDEAYLPFTSEEYRPDSRPLILAGRPLITMGSFSKIYGLAGLRVGFAMAPPEIIGQMAKVREPFAVNSLAQAAAAAALEDEEFRLLSVNNNQEQRAALQKGLAELGLFTPPSQSNFVFVELGRPAPPVCEFLLDLGVQVRGMGPWGAPDCLRVTVGRPEENRAFLEALKKALRKKP